MQESFENIVNDLLENIQQGNAEAKDQLISVAYDRLHELAHNHLLGERTALSWQTTDVVNEAVLRVLPRELSKIASVDSNDKQRYFFGAMSQAMKQLLVDHARSRNASKRGGDQNRVPLDDVIDYFHKQRVDMLELSEALTQLKKHDERLAEVVELRIFSGMAHQDIARCLNVSLSSEEKYWRLARAWLRGTLTTQGICDE